MSHKPLNIGICGVGTVGIATIEILQKQREALISRSGRSLRVNHVGARREHTDHDYGDARVSRDVIDLA